MQHITHFLIITKMSELFTRTHTRKKEKNYRLRTSRKMATLETREARRYSRKLLNEMKRLTRSER